MHFLVQPDVWVRPSYSSFLNASDIGLILSGRFWVDSWSDKNLFRMKNVDW